MDLAPYVEQLRQQLAMAAAAGGDEAQLLADRLIAALEPATRLVLLDALSTAANEITSDLAPGSVEVRLRQGDPEFVVTSPPVDAAASAGADRRADLASVAGSTSASPPPTDNDDGGTSRITLRLAEQLKSRIEDAAGRDGLSVNAWLVRSVAAALDPDLGEPRPHPAWPTGGQRFTGWAR